MKEGGGKRVKMIERERERERMSERERVSDERESGES